MTQFGLSFIHVKTLGNVGTEADAPVTVQNAMDVSSVRDIQSHFLQRLDNGYAYGVTLINAFFFYVSVSHLKKYVKTQVVVKVLACPFTVSI